MIRKCFNLLLGVMLVLVFSGSAYAGLMGDVISVSMDRYDFSSNSYIPVDYDGSHIIPVTVAAYEEFPARIMPMITVPGVSVYGIPTTTWQITGDITDDTFSINIDEVSNTGFNYDLHRFATYPGFSYLSDKSLFRFHVSSIEDEIINISLLNNIGGNRCTFSSSSDGHEFDFALWGMKDGDSYTFKADFAPNPTATPVPAAAWLFLTGLVGLFRLRCR